MRILLLEDNYSDAELTVKQLKSSFQDCAIEVVSSLKLARELLLNDSFFDVALLDMKLPDGTGLDLLLEIRRLEMHIAVVILTGHGDEDIAVASLKAGADDFVTKRDNYIERLPQIIQFVVRKFKQNTQIRSTPIEVLYIEHQAIDVDLTQRHLRQYAPNINLRNVPTAEEALALIEHSGTSGLPFHLILIDYRLPGMNALEFIKTVRQDFRNEIPVILVTGQGNEDIAIEALKLGANDYLTKTENYYYRLPSMIIAAYQHNELIKKQAELEVSEKKYKLLAENSDDVIFLLDQDLRFTYISPSIRNLSGFEPDEALKLKLSELICPGSYQKAVDTLQEILEAKSDQQGQNSTPKIIDLELIKTDRTTVWTELKASLIHDADNSFSGILGVLRDISIRRKANLELLKLSRAVEQSPNSIIITNPDGVVEYVNPKFIEITGYSFAESVGHSINFLKSGYTTDDQYKTLWNTILSGHEWRGELYNKRKDGSFFWESVAISSIINDEGKIINFLAVKEDITEKKRNELELIAAKDKAEESDRLKTAFLHNISHEIRTPMNSIVGFSEFLNEPDLLPEQMNEFTGIITNSCHQLLSIIDDIVNIATIEAGQAKIVEKEINLNALLDTLFRQFQPEAQKLDIDFNLSTAFPDSGSDILMDETKLTQIISNLLGNALKFTGKGYIHFGYQMAESQVEPKMLEFFVEDSGIGIPDEMQDEIFKRFRQVESSIARKFGGSGLGLSISKAYVELFGGQMWVNSEIGKGSVFYFTIPYKRNEKTVHSPENISASR